VRRYLVGRLFFSHHVADAAALREFSGHGIRRDDFISLLYSMTYTITPLNRKKSATEAVSEPRVCGSPHAF